MGSRKRITAALVGLVLLVLLGWLLGVGNVQFDSGSSDPQSSIRTSPGAPPANTATGAVSSPATRFGLPVRALSELPAEAADTWRLIERGGPFPYPRNDGTTFQNREKLLPLHDRGHYREYTVPTPGSPDRGPRRLVTGAEDELFYTDDHYGSFVVVDPGR